MTNTAPPLLPLLLADVPPALVRALEQAGVPAVSHAQSPAAGRFILHDSRRGANPPLREGQTVIDVDQLRSCLGDDPFALLDETTALRTVWRIGSLPVSEEVAAIDRRQVRLAMLDELRSLVERAGGIWLVVAPFPFPYRSAFNLRIDHDTYVAGDHERLLKALSRRGDACTHFICAGGFNERPEVLEPLRGLDVGSHGYHHHTYLDRRDNLRNIARGIEQLRRWGFEPRGFVAPHGRYPAGLGSVLTELGIPYSSEFGLAYDELPFIPADGTAWQVPVHPICLGICLEGARNLGGDPQLANRTAVAAFSAHWQEQATQNYQAGEPLFFYGHPDGRLGRWPSVVERLLTHVDSFGALWRVTLDGWIRWWEARRRVRLSVIDQRGTYRVCVEHAPREHRLALHYWRGGLVAPMSVDEPVVQFRPEALAYQSLPARRSTPALRLRPAVDWRSRVKRFLDWEKATPIDELRSDSLRGWLKKTLRKARPA